MFSQKMVRMLISLLAVHISAAMCQEELYTCDQIQSSMTNWTTAGVFGFVLGGAGLVSSIAGVVTLNSAQETYYEKNVVTGEERGDKRAGIGGALIGIGIPTGIMGAILGSVSFSKRSYWQNQKRMYQCAWHLNVGPNQARIIVDF